MNKHFQLSANKRKSDLLTVAKRATSPHGWVALISLNPTDTLGSVSKWLVRAADANFSSFIFLADECGRWPRYAFASSILCRRPSNETFYMRGLRPPEQYSSKHLRTEFVLSLFQLNISFVYSTDLRGVSITGPASTFELTDYLPYRCDVAIWRQISGATVAVRPSKMTFWFWRSVVECQRKQQVQKVHDENERLCLFSLSKQPQFTNHISFCET